MARVRVPVKVIRAGIKRAVNAKALTVKAVRKAPKVIKASLKRWAKPALMLDARKELATWDKAVLTVGIHAAEGATVKGSLTVAQIMTVHEFGSEDGSIPMRSWLRGWFDESQEQMSGLVRDMTKAIAKGKLKAKTALARLGSIAVAEIQARWARTPGDWAPLAERTIARKKSSKPLIDTGQARTSVTYQVRYK